MNFYFSVSHLVFFILLLSLTVRVTVADDEKDKEECTQELVGMATCLPYVGGDAKAPTPDCCSGLKQVLKNNKKCLCVIIKDRDDPDLGLQINVTLALTLPETCHAPANVSQCPALLKLDPNSPEAQVFYQLGNNSSSHDAVPPTSPAPSINSTGTSHGSKIKPEKGEACNRGRKWLPIGGLLLWFLMNFAHSL